MKRNGNKVGHLMFVHIQCCTALQEDRAPAWGQKGWGPVSVGEECFIPWKA